MLRIVFLLLLPINKIGLDNISPGNVFCFGWQLWIFFFFVEITLEADVTNFVDSGWGGCTESVEKTKHVFWKSWMIFWWLHNIFFQTFHQMKRWNINKNRAAVLFGVSNTAQMCVDWKNNKKAKKQNKVDVYKATGSAENKLAMG